MKITQEKIAELRALDAAGTQGQWNICSSGNDWAKFGVGPYVNTWVQANADGALLAAARNALPDIMDDLEAAREIIAALRMHEDVTHSLIADCWRALAKQDDSLHVLPSALEAILAKHSEVEKDRDEARESLKLVSESLEKSVAREHRLREALQKVRERVRSKHADLEARDEEACDIIEAALADAPPVDPPDQKDVRIGLNSFCEKFERETRLVPLGEEDPAKGGSVFNWRIWFVRKMKEEIRNEKNQNS
jgi:hypothetical protein